MRDKGRSSRSIGEILDETRGIGRGFDFLRIALALSIVAFHALTVTNHYYPLDDTAFWMVHYALVPMFFALSGFLVCASAQRLSLKDFLINRGVRIVPALAVDTVVCALVIGPLFTTQRLAAYFGNTEFYSYFWNMVGFVHFNLPGVFETFPVARVNGSLWTVPFELLCYALITALIFTGLIRRRFGVLALVVGYLIVSILVQVTGLPAMIHGASLRKVVQIAFLEYEAQAVTAFLCGIVAYQNRARIRYSPLLFCACVASMLCVALLLSNAKGQAPAMRFLLMPIIVYATIFIGLTPITLPKLMRSGDYSYGIYLYHQPFLQIVVSLLPAMALHRHYGAVFTFLLGLPFVIGVAVLSWHFVEKPTLAWRRRYSMAAKMRNLTPTTPPVVRDEPSVHQLAT